MASRRARSASQAPGREDVDLAVVLDRHPHGRIGQVVLPQDLAVLVADLEVDLRLRQAGEHEEHPQPSLHGRVDVAPDVRRRMPRRGRRRVRSRRAEGDECLGGDQPPSDHRVPQDHEVDQTDEGRHLDEQPARLGHAHAPEQPRARPRPADMDRHPLVAASLTGPRDAHLLPRDRRDGQVVGPRRGGVTRPGDVVVWQQRSPDPYDRGDRRGRRDVRRRKGVLAKRPGVSVAGSSMPGIVPGEDLPACAPSTGHAQLR